MPTIRDVAALLEAWAPPASAQSYDNVGLQVGDASRRVERALISLDLTPQVVEEAKARRATLIVTHHPTIFRPVGSVTAVNSLAALPFRLAESGIAHYAIHTNLDAAVDGVSFALAAALHLQEVSFLRPFDDVLHKIAVFVPVDHLDRVRAAMASAGAGHIGEYEGCAFASPGTGFFKPGAGASPFIGEAGGEAERVEEARLEVEVPRWHLRSVLKAMRGAHPYDEVAYDVYDVRQAHSRTGFGAIGTLPEAVPLRQFLKSVSENLRTPSLRYAGYPEDLIERVAVCGGAGSDLIDAALRAGADAYVTADLTYHKFFDVYDGNGKPRMALVDAGHYETESITEALLQKHLRENLPEVEWLIAEHATNPVSYFTTR